MPELEVKVETYRVEYWCDEPECDGRMVFGGMTLTSCPPQYPHSCDKCGARQNMRTVYPTTRQREVLHD